jgi:uncharacterized C2H2 Zn-finger protein
MKASEHVQTQAWSEPHPQFHKTRAGEFQSLQKSNWINHIPSSHKYLNAENAPNQKRKKKKSK